MNKKRPLLVSAAAVCDHLQLATMATAHRKEVLQGSLMLAVYHGHLKAVEEAGACLKEHFSKTAKPSGPQVLDFRITSESHWKPLRRVCFSRLQ